MGAQNKYRDYLFFFLAVVDESTARKCRRIFAVVVLSSHRATTRHGFSRNEMEICGEVPFSRTSIKDSGERRGTPLIALVTIGRCGFISSRVIESFSAANLLLLPSFSL